MKYFSLIEPAPEGETAVIVEVPHAGLSIDAETLANCIAPAQSIGQDADLLVADLFQDAPSLGAHLLHTHMSRYVCDLNRDEQELDGRTSPLGTAASAPHGVVWRKTTDGRAAIPAPLAPSEVERRLALFYRPYHRELYRLVQQKLDRFGFVVLLSAHSMPSFGRMGERRADIVPGTRGRTTAGREVILACDSAAARAGYDVAHDTPYRGGYTTGRYGSPASHVHALQVELSRRVYMDESLLRPIPDQFSACVRFCNDLVVALGELELAT
jgi:N-formylglutamate deformylase